MNDERTVNVEMTMKMMEFVVQMINFAWKNGAIRDPETASFAEDFRKEMQNKASELSLPKPLQGKKDEVKL